MPVERQFNFFSPPGSTLQRLIDVLLATPRFDFSFQRFSFSLRSLNPQPIWRFVSRRPGPAPARPPRQPKKEAQPTIGLLRACIT